jgi:hypothetical protein
MDRYAKRIAPLLSDSFRRPREGHRVLIADERCATERLGWRPRERQRDLFPTDMQLAFDGE